MPIDFETRVIELLDDLADKVDKLCERQTKTETQLENHFDEMDRSQRNKQRKFYYVIGLMGVGFTIQEIIRGLI